MHFTARIQYCIIAQEICRHLELPELCYVDIVRWYGWLCRQYCHTFNENVSLSIKTTSQMMWPIGQPPAFDGLTDGQTLLDFLFRLPDGGSDYRAQRHVSFKIQRDTSASTATSPHHWATRQYTEHSYMNWPISSSMIVALMAYKRRLLRFCNIRMYGADTLVIQSNKKVAYNRK